MAKVFITIALIARIFSSSAQVKDASSNLTNQVTKMGDAFIKSDFKTFASYTYPAISKSMGGSAKMAATLTKTISDMKGQGMTFSKITFDEPTKIIKSGNELQSTIAQHTDIKLTQGRIVSTSTLIAVSIDNGNNWTFIDTSNKDLKTLKKSIPNLSSQLIIPAPQPPVRYNQ
jgi:hypothetical protein